MGVIKGLGALGQIIGVVVALAWSGIWTFVICKLLEATTGFRVTEEEEDVGLDASLHGEVGLTLLQFTSNCVAIHL